MSVFGVFDALDTNEGEQRIAARDANQVLERAIHAVSEDFGTFLGAAKDKDDFTDRIALVKSDMMKRVAEFLMPKPGVMRRVVASQKPDFARSVEKQSSRIDTIRSIVETQGHQNIDGLLVDINTANLLLQAYEKGSDKTKQVIETVDLQRVVDKLWSLTARRKQADSTGPIDGGPLIPKDDFDGYLWERERDVAEVERADFAKDSDRRASIYEDEGYAAHGRGDMRAPSLNNVVNDGMKSRPVGDPANQSIMEDFTKGYDRGTEEQLRKDFPELYSSRKTAGDPSGLAPAPELNGGSWESRRGTILTQNVIDRVDLALLAQAYASETDESVLLPALDSATRMAWQNGYRNPRTAARKTAESHSDDRGSYEIGSTGEGFTVYVEPLSGDSEGREFNTAAEARAFAEQVLSSPRIVPSTGEPVGSNPHFHGKRKEAIQPGGLSWEEVAELLEQCKSDNTSERAAARKKLAVFGIGEEGGTSKDDVSPELWEESQFAFQHAFDWAIDQGVDSDVAEGYASWIAKRTLSLGGLQEAGGSHPLDFESWAGHPVWKQSRRKQADNPPKKVDPPLSGTNEQEMKDDAEPLDPTVAARDFPELRQAMKDFPELRKTAEDYAWVVPDPNNVDRWLIDNGWQYSEGVAEGYHTEHWYSSPDNQLRSMGINSGDNGWDWYLRQAGSTIVSGTSQFLADAVNDVLRALRRSMGYESMRQQASKDFPELAVRAESFGKARRA